MIIMSLITAKHTQISHTPSWGGGEIFTITVKFLAHIAYFYCQYEYICIDKVVVWILKISPTVYSIFRIASSWYKQQITSKQRSLKRISWTSFETNFRIFWLDWTVKQKTFKLIVWFQKTCIPPPWGKLEIPKGWGRGGERSRKFQREGVVSEIMFPDSQVWHSAN